MYEVYDRLIQLNDIEVWLDLKNINYGTNWMDVIKNGLDTSDFMLLVASSTSLKSQFVKREWTYYIAQKKPILVFLIDNTEIDPELKQNNVPIIDIREDPLDMMCWLESLANYTSLLETENDIIYLDEMNDEKVIPNFVNSFVFRKSLFWLVWQIILITFFVYHWDGIGSSVRIAIITVFVIDYLMKFSSLSDIRARSTSSETFGVLYTNPIIIRLIFLIIFSFSQNFDLIVPITWITLAQFASIVVLQSWFFSNHHYAYSNQFLGEFNQQWLTLPLIGNFIFEYLGSKTIRNSKIRGWLIAEEDQIDFRKSFHEIMSNPFEIAEEEEAFPVNDQFFVSYTSTTKAQVNERKSNPENKKQASRNNAPQNPVQIGANNKTKSVYSHSETSEEIIQPGKQIRYQSKAMKTQEIEIFDKSMAILYHAFDEPYIVAVVDEAFPEINIRRTVYDHKSVDDFFIITISDKSIETRRLKDVSNMRDIVSDVYIFIYSQYSSEEFSKIYSQIEDFEGSTFVNLILDDIDKEDEAIIVSHQWIDGHIELSNTARDLRNSIFSERHLLGRLPRKTTLQSWLIMNVGLLILWYMNVFFVVASVLSFDFYRNGRPLPRDFNYTFLLKTNYIIPIIILTIIHLVIVGRKNFLDGEKRKLSFSFLTSVQFVSYLIFSVTVLPLLFLQLRVGWAERSSIRYVALIPLIMTILCFIWSCEAILVGILPALRKRVYTGSYSGLFWMGQYSYYLPLVKSPQKPFELKLFLVHTGIITIIGVIMGILIYL